MSEKQKYTINQHKYCQNIVLSDECIIVCKDKNGDTDNETAELVCKLLNENEERKNKPKIDAEILEYLIDCLVSKMNGKSLQQELEESVAILKTLGDNSMQNGHQPNKENLDISNPPRGFLNENESRTKIDKDFKEQMLNHFRSECFTKSKWLNDQYENLIEIISNLPTEE